MELIYLVLLFKWWTIQAQPNPNLNLSYINHSRIKKKVHSRIINNADEMVGMISSILSTYLTISVHNHFKWILLSSFAISSSQFVAHRSLCERQWTILKLFNLHCKLTSSILYTFFPSQYSQNGFLWRLQNVFYVKV